MSLDEPQRDATKAQIAKLKALIATLDKQIPGIGKQVAAALNEPAKFTSAQLADPLESPIPAPREDGSGGWVAPDLSPNALLRIADVCKAFAALEMNDMQSREITEGRIMVGWHEPIPVVWDDPYLGGNSSARGSYVHKKSDLMGWIVHVDAGTWNFVPYVPEIEDGGA